MCKRIAAGLACIALICGVANAVPRQPTDEPAAIHLPTSSSLPAQSADTVPPSPHDPYNSTVLPGAADPTRYASQPAPQPAAAPQPAFTQPTPFYAPHPNATHQPAPQYYPPAIAPVAPIVAPAPAGCPGAFTIITNGDSEILLDTRNGDSWLLAKSNDFDRWRQIKRDQKNDAGDAAATMKRAWTAPTPAAAAAQANESSATPAAAQSEVDELREAIGQLNARRARDIEAFRRMVQQLTEVQQKLSSQQRADEKLSKATKTIEALVSKANELLDENAKLKSQLQEARSRPRIGVEMMTPRGPIIEEEEEERLGVVEE